MKKPTVTTRPHRTDRGTLSTLDGRLFPLLTGGLLLVLHAFIFLKYFPNHNQALGHDYAYHLPALLDGFFWYQTNGMGEIPWFTPSVCGGSLVYPNPVRGYYTVSQFLTFLLPPLTAVRITLVAFALLGLWGTYQLLRNAFYLSRPAASFGAGVFLFNGFFAHRMLIGHLGYCHFMLIPLIAYLVLKPLPGIKNGRLGSLLRACVLGGLLLALAVQSEFVILIIPAVLAIFLIGLVHVFMEGKFAQFLLRLGITGLFGILFSLSRLSAILYMMSSFPRNAYSLPGAEGFWKATGLILRSLSISPAYDPTRLNGFTNIQFFLDRHEWEYSVTPVPFIVIAIGFAGLLLQLRNCSWPLKLTVRRWALVALAAFLLVIPVALNSYYPVWNTFLKQLPIIGSSSSLIRWTSAYIPIIALFSALVIEKSSLFNKYRATIAVVCLAAMVFLNSVTNRDYYHVQNYDPTSITAAYGRVRGGTQVPIINQIMVNQDNRGDVLIPVSRNDTIAFNGSQLFCYEPLFGYWLESFPRGNLHPGPVTALQAGRYNLKNPVCYIWPHVNHCAPGDHFAESSLTAVEAFRGYRPFAFEMSAGQKAANWLNGAALVAASLYLSLSGLLLLIKRRW